MEYRVVAAINGVAAIHIRHDSISHFLGPRGLVVVDLLEVCLLVCACVCPEHRLVVDVVRVCSTAAWVVWSEAENVEVQCRRHDRILLDIIPIHWIRELVLNQTPCDGQRVVLVEVESAADMREDRVGCVGPLVCSV